ncbi:signal peptidase I [Corynebacterium poyangense]|uniref:Signal peptidase I n=1 Tax=Corynebacterium poyangense TaxID=2684405 RepID=A0A7H0SPJ6_9CORY|nr:signal peptidase I [Corynebacterium poyangense]QNQ90471.1 signal peptidase I [Corynebacterium poyangense]
MTDSFRISAPEDDTTTPRDSQPTSHHRVRKERKQLPWYVEIPLVIVITLALIFVIQTFIGRMYVIPSQSMEPTLHGCTGCTGDRIVVDKVTYHFSDPQPGDVVVFKGAPSWDTSFISQRSENPFIRGIQNGLSYVGLVAPDENDLVKRIIATGGQTVSCLPGDPGIMVDGKQIDSAYILSPPTYPVDPQIGSTECGGPYFGPITVPADHYFMMGDNRTNSKDSRYHLGDEFQGTIPRENIRGKVQAIVFPFSRIGAVESRDIHNQ